MEKKTSIPESSLSSTAQRKAHAQPENNIVFAKPSANGYKIFSVEPDKLKLAKAQGALLHALIVDFGK